MNATMKEPLYISERSTSSLGQKYRIFDDHIELNFWLFPRKLRVHHENITSLKVVHPVFNNKNDEKFMVWFWGLFLDWAAFNRHVLIKTRSYWARYIHFTPDDPDAFVEACNSISKHGE